jgi:hypothetical protein
MKATQILQASVLGTIAFNAGKKCVPAWDKDLMQMLSGRMIGQAPAGEASSVAILKAWSDAWHNANLSKNAN